MKITFCCTDTKAEPWLQGLAAALATDQGLNVGERAAAWAALGGHQRFFLYVNPRRDSSAAIEE